MRIFIPNMHICPPKMRPGGLTGPAARGAMGAHAILCMEPRLYNIYSMRAARPETKNRRKKILSLAGFPFFCTKTVQKKSRIYEK